MSDPQSTARSGETGSFAKKPLKYPTYEAFLAARRERYRLRSLDPAFKARRAANRKRYRALHKDKINAQRRALYAAKKIYLTSVK